MIQRRRQAIELANAHFTLWSIGNGLTTGTLVTYLLIELGAQGLEIGLLLAVPALVGLLRLGSPWIVRRCGGLKRACVIALLVSYLLFFSVPTLLVAELDDTKKLRLLIALISLHQLLEYIGQVALYAWLAELVPLRIRGRFFARRNMFQLAVLVPTLLASGYFVQQWRKEDLAATPGGMLLGFAAPLSLGGLFLLASIGPLLKAPQAEPPRRVPSHPTSGGWRALLAPFHDAPFRRLLLYRAWFSFSNGVTQSAQSFYPWRVLQLDTGAMNAMRSTMQVGQFGLSPWLGRTVDRLGARPVLVASQLLVSLGLGFFLVAQPDQSWLLWGAWLLWSAYAGINICLPTLTLKFSPAADERPAYIAAQEAVGSICYAASTVAGGYALDRLLADSSQSGAAAALSPYAAMFLAGVVLRCLAIPLAARIRE